MSATIPLKICPVVLRNVDGGPAILALHHPETGKQLLRETATGDAPARHIAPGLLKDATGLKANAAIDLGQSKGIVQNQNWHFIALAVDGARQSWVSEDMDGEPVTFFFQKLDEYLDEDEWEPLFIRAIAHIRNRLERADPAQRDRLMPPINEEIAEAITTMALERGTEKSLCPSEVARHLAGEDEKAWRAMMKPIRTEAVRLALEGQLAITRKGKEVDPSDFKGIYRITVPKD